MRVGRWGEAGNNSSRGWELGRGREWMDLHHVRVKVWRGGSCIAVVGGEGGTGLNVIHGRGRLLSVCYRSLSCEVYILLDDLNYLSDS